MKCFNNEIWSLLETSFLNSCIGHKCDYRLSKNVMVLIKPLYFTYITKSLTCQQNIYSRPVHTLDFNISRHKTVSANIGWSNYFFFVLCTAFVGKPFQHQIPLKQLPKTISGCSTVVGTLFTDNRFVFTRPKEWGLSQLLVDQDLYLLLPIKERLCILRQHQMNSSPPTPLISTLTLVE